MLSVHFSSSLRLTLCIAAAAVLAGPSTLPAQPEPYSPQPVGDVVPRRNRQQLESYRSRAAQLLLTESEWLTQTAGLDAGQLERLPPLRDAMLTAEMERFEQSRLSALNYRIGETFPGLFVVPGSAGFEFSGKFADAVSAEICTDEQRQRVKAAVESRRSDRLRSYRDHAVAIAVDDLFLTTDQRDKLVAALADSKLDAQPPFYSFDPRSSLLLQQSLRPLMPAAFRAELFPGQAAWLNRPAADPGRTGAIRIVLPVNPDEWHLQLEGAARGYRDDFLELVRMRVEYLGGEYDLPEEKVSRMMTAAKGMAEQHSRAWIEEQLATFRPVALAFPSAPRNLTVNPPAITSEDLANNALWQRALSEVSASLDDAPEEQRHEFRIRARAELALQLLDEELWLRPEQRERLRPLVMAAVPQDKSPLETDSDLREIVWLTHALFRIADDSLQKVLAPQQVAQWDRMRSYFARTLANNNSRHIVRFPLEGGGTKEFMLAD